MCNCKYLFPIKFHVKKSKTSKHLNAFPFSSSSCCSWRDHLLTLGIWWRSPTESHFLTSPSNENHFKATFQIIRHFRWRTWSTNKSSSQQSGKGSDTSPQPGRRWTGGKLGGERACFVRFGEHVNRKTLGESFPQPMSGNEKHRRSAQTLYRTGLNRTWNRSSDYSSRWQTDRALAQTGSHAHRLQNVFLGGGWP